MMEENNKRKVRKFTIDIDDKLGIEYGWMDRNSTDVMYLYIKCWITPTKEFNYPLALKRIVNNACDNLKSSVSNDGSYYDKFIFDSFYNVDSIAVGASRFVALEAFLRRKKDDQYELDIESYDDKIKALLGDFCEKYVKGLENVGFDVRREKNR